MGDKLQPQCIYLAKYIKTMCILHRVCCEFPGILFGYVKTLEVLTKISSWSVEI